GAASASTTVSVGIDLALAPAEAFSVLVDELASALEQAGMGFAPGAIGCVTQGEREVGRVVSWEPGKLMRLEWQPAEWQPAEMTEVALRLGPPAHGGGTPPLLEPPGRGTRVPPAPQPPPPFPRPPPP